MERDLDRDREAERDRDSEREDRLRRGGDSERDRDLRHNQLHSRNNQRTAYNWKAFIESGTKTILLLTLSFYCRGLGLVRLALELVD